jgi:hypothetical protein
MCNVYGTRTGLKCDKEVDCWNRHLSATEGSLSILTEISCRIDIYVPRHEVFMLYVSVRFRPVLTKVCIESYPDPD